MSTENKWYADLWIIKLLSPTLTVPIRLEEAYILRQLQKLYYSITVTVHVSNFGG